MIWHAWHYGWMTVAAAVAPVHRDGALDVDGQAHVRIDYLAAFNKAALAVPENERAWPIYRDALWRWVSAKGKLRRRTPRWTNAKPGDAELEGDGKVSERARGVDREIARGRQSAEPRFCDSPFQADF